MEIERKFRLKEIPDICQGLNAVLISQGYLALANDEVRLRRQGNKSFLTCKSGTGLVRNELEIFITAEQFDILWPATEGRRLQKMRTTIPWGKHHIEIDQYLGALSPLIVAEVEFSSVDESATFEPPAFLGLEITGDANFSNAALCEKGLLS